MIPQGGHEGIFTGTTPDVIARAILENLYHVQGRAPLLATPNDWYMALAHTVRDRLLSGWIQSLRMLAREIKDIRFVSYLSAEFLMGPHLGNSLISLGLYEQARQAAHQLGLDFEHLLAQEEDPGWETGGWED